jgi:hypothetical protein
LASFHAQRDQQEQQDEYGKGHAAKSGPTEEPIQSSVACNHPVDVMGHCHT